MNSTKRRRKQGLRLFIAYSLRIAMILIPLVCVFLMICGCLYIRDFFQKRSGEDQQNASSQQEIQPGHDTGTEDDAIIPVPPTVRNNAVVVLDAGHGGIEPGCEFSGVLEKDIVLSVTLLLREKLEDMGITVILTRAADEDVSLSKRSDIANAADADCFISIHCNSYIEDTQINGFEGYYYRSEEGKRLSECILSAAEKHPINVRNTKEENYQVLRESTAPAALLEIGFLSNPEERQALSDADYQNTLSTAIAEGIAMWLNG